MNSKCGFLSGSMEISQEKGHHSLTADLQQLDPQPLRDEGSHHFVGDGVSYPTNITVLLQPSYSPNLALCDLFMFPKVTIDIIFTW